MGEWMEHEVGQAGELARESLKLGIQEGAALGMLAAALGDGGLLEPSGNALGVELEEDPFAAIFDSGQPGTVERERCAFYIEGEVALNIRAGGFKTGEPDLGDNFPEAMHEHNAFNGRHPGGAPLGFGQRAGEEVAIGNVGAQLVLGLGKGFKFDFLNWPLGGAAALPEAGYGGENGGVLDALQLDCEGRDLPDEREFFRRIHDRQPGVPGGLDNFVQGRLGIGDGNDGHELREIRGAGAANQEAVRFAATLLGAGTEPRAGAVAGAKRTKLHSGGLGHGPIFAALADNPNLVEVAGGAAFFHPQVARAGRGGAA